MRYCRQRDGYSCGPVVVLNSMKWAGMQVSYDRVKSMKRTRGFNPIKGIGPGYLDPLIRSSLKGKCLVKYRVNPRLIDIKKHLQENGAVILLHEEIGKNAHYSLLVDVSSTGKSYTIVNFYHGAAVTQIRKHTLMICLGHITTWHPRAWFLRKL